MIKKVKALKGRDASQKLHMKGAVKIFHDFESTKDKMLEAGPDLERSMTIC